jgi:hypothetical protein
MTANFYDAAPDYPEEGFEKITRRMLGVKEFPIKSATFKRERRKAFDLGRRK